ncbi:MAG: CotH kinase family protein, partial [Sedimentisphaerales bacterium]|nr:CotH kinase family protein [Sedimentisphaerales bacterium]
MKRFVIYSTAWLLFFINSYASAALIHRYSFTDGDTAAVDSVGGAHGTLVNGAVISGDAAQLDGQNDYVALPAGLITGRDSVTLEAWFQFSDNGAWVRVFDFGDTNPDSGAGRNYLFFTPQGGTGTSRLVISDADPGYNHEEVVNYSLLVHGVPTHIACVFDGVNDVMTLYVNGEWIDSIPVTIPLSAVNNLNSYLGRSLYTADPCLKGALDEFRVYDGVLDGQEILTNYTLGPDAPYASNVAVNPTPANGAVGVVPSIRLSWEAPSSGTPDSYTVYVSDEADLAGAQVINVPQGTDCAPQLDYDTSYYWRVDCHYGGTTFTGVVWTFTTSTPAWDRSPVGDINHDFTVDLLDLLWMADDWLSDANSPANLVGSDGGDGPLVDNADYARLAGHWLASASPLVINEFLADNNQNRADPNGEYDDWIELYNSGDVAIDLGGMYLTDNLDNPDKWPIPPGITIAPGEHLIFWADGHQQQGETHTNFQLDAAGDEIGLYDRDGRTRLDCVVFDRQYADISYGRYPDGAPEWRFFDAPSFAGCNYQGYLGIVADCQFSVDGGFYADPDSFDVTIYCETPGATIHYTTNFTKPTEDSAEYTDPVGVDSTTCLRAVAYKPGWLTRGAASRSYIFLDDVMQQSAYPPGFPTSWGSLIVDYQVDPDVVGNPAYSGTFKDDLRTVPSVCIVIPNDDLFGSVSGIYSHPTQRGPAWEREASIEIINPATGEYCQANAGLRMHGGYARTTNTAKQSLRMIFRSLYGPSKLEFPLFPDSPVTTFDQLVLRATWNYSWTGDSGGATERAQYMRELYAHDTIRDMDRLQGYGRHVHVYLNGLYWGVYILTERPDDGFASEHLGGRKSDYDVVKTNAEYWTGPNVIEVLAGDRQAWDQLFILAQADLSTPEAYAAIQRYVDIPAMIDYMLMIFHTGSRDAPVLIGNDTAPRNFYAVRKREPGAGFVFLPWDVEWSLEGETLDRVNVANYINGYDNPAYLTAKLKTNAEFRMRVADQAYKHYFNNGALTEENTVGRYWNRVMDLDRAIVGESARWGDFRRATPYTRNVEWVAERNRLVNSYFPARDGVVLAQLRSAGLYPDLDPPVFCLNGSEQHGGYAALGASLSMTNPNGSGTIHYTLDATDPRLPASAASQITLAGEYADKRVWVPAGDIGTAWRSDTSYDDSGWDLCTGSPGGVGYEAGSGYQGLIGLDMTEDMYGAGKNTTCYVRIPFGVSAGDLAALQFLRLKVRYDDAFVAYLNGNPVAVRNFTGTPQWNSHSDNDQHEASTGGWDEMIDISDHLGDLQAGDNLLAIQAMNYTPTSSDFVICAELVAGDNGNGDGISPAAIAYGVPIVLAKSTLVKARVLDNGTWSALHEAVYAIADVAQKLRITEMMYHPAEPPTGSGYTDEDFEFIELKHIGLPGEDAINLD